MIQINVKKHSSEIAIVEIGGKIDVYNSDEFKNTLSELIDKKVIHILCDFTNVGYIDSAGIGVIIFIDRKIKSAGGTLNVVNAEDSIEQIFKVTKLTTHIGIFKSIKAALEKKE